MGITLEYNCLFLSPETTTMMAECDVIVTFTVTETRRSIERQGILFFADLEEH